MKSFNNIIVLSTTDKLLEKFFFDFGKETQILEMNIFATFYEHNLLMIRVDVQFCKYNTYDLKLQI